METLCICYIRLNDVCDYVIVFALDVTASIELKNWNPLAVDAVTGDCSATVGAILKDLTSLVTVRLRLNRYIMMVHAARCSF